MLNSIDNIFNLELILLFSIKIILSLVEIV